MSTPQKLFFVAWFATIARGCGVTGNSSKFSFADGYYRTRLNGKKYKKYYVTTGTDSIKVYPAHISRQIADTVNSITVFFPQHIRPVNFAKKTFSSSSFDLDVITILFKCRPPVTIIRHNEILISMALCMQVPQGFLHLVLQQYSFTCSQ